MNGMKVRPHTMHPVNFTVVVDRHLVSIVL
jgi:hypothetical protein